LKELGGRIDERSYAPLLHNITAISGYSCYLTKFPFYVSFFGINNADFALQMASNITQWTIAGHSLGGVGAGFYIAEVLKSPNILRNRVKGLVFHASYSTSDIRSFSGKVSSIFGSLDGQTDYTKYESEYKSVLPGNSSFHLIQGANHFQFSSYVERSLQDGIATISADIQKLIVANLTVDLMESAFRT
jgi:hypothetical protein